MLFLEGLSVCVGYSDFLAWTLPYNKSLFNNLVVVTTKEDKLTQKLCEHYHVRCIQSNVCYEDGAKFNKAKMINVGLEALNRKGWCLHFDADIAFMPKTRLILEKLEPTLKEDCIYSFDRLNCNSFKDWMKFWYEPTIINENEIFVHARFPVATRLARGGYNWVPLGYTQMFHSSARQTYPDEHTDAARTDLQFSESYPREKRIFLPEIYCVHLESELSPMGQNWEGRKTKRFGEEIVGPFPEKVSNQTYETGWDI